MRGSGVGGCYYLYNALSELDIGGEYHIDPTALTLRFLPPPAALMSERGARHVSEKEKKLSRGCMRPVEVDVKWSIKWMMRMDRWMPVDTVVTTTVEHVKGHPQPLQGPPRLGLPLRSRPNFPQYYPRKHIQSRPCIWNLRQIDGVESVAGVALGSRLWC